MVDKVLELENQLKRCIDQGMPFTDLQALKQEIQSKIFKHANFLRQKLEIWMFVPCKLVNDEWVFLEEPASYKEYLDLKSKNMKFGSFFAQTSCDEYQEAKDRVLFEGFTIIRERGLSGEKYPNSGVFISLAVNDNYTYSGWYFKGIIDSEDEENTIEHLANKGFTLTQTAKKQLS